MDTKSYIKAKELLLNSCSEKGFLASAKDISNYKRIWARDGSITALAALLDGDEKLIQTARQTFETLLENQHDLGHLPNNVDYATAEPSLSFGGLAGRVDAISWIIIGICNYTFFTKDYPFLENYYPNLKKALRILDIWEFNNNHLLYTPRSGNWADEYILEGHVFYDNILRLWALQCFYHYFPEPELKKKIVLITKKLEDNYRSGSIESVYHPNGYKNLQNTKFWMAAITPSGYQTMFDALGNSLALLMNLGDKPYQLKLISYAENLRRKMPLQLLPAFWDIIDEEHEYWFLLKENHKYEFRNYPYTFHNGGTWGFINAFYGISMVKKDSGVSENVLQKIQELNAVENYSYYENFDSKNSTPNGVPFCTWNAAGEIILTQYLQGNHLLIQ